MHQAFLISVAVAVGAVVVGWILRRIHRVDRLAQVVGLVGAALVRVLAAIVLAWNTVWLLGHPSALHIAVAVVLVPVGLWMALSAALLLYAAVMGNGKEPNAGEPS